LNRTSPEVEGVPAYSTTKKSTTATLEVGISKKPIDTLEKHIKVYIKQGFLRIKMFRSVFLRFEKIMSGSSHIFVF
jgi:hypothetical protein